MEHRPPKRRLLNDAEESESASQKRAKTNPEEKEDGKIEYKIQRRSPSFAVDSAASHPATKKDEISAQRPFGAEKTSMTFPEKIMRILSFPEFFHVIRWNLDGTEFCIFPDSFSEAVLEPHFQGTKFQSFTRKLNRFGFKRILDEDRYPKGTFAYHQDYFQRGREDLLPLIEIDSDKKQQRQISVPGPVCLVRNPPAWEESKDQYRSRSLDHFASQLSGVASSSSPLAAARVPVASGYLPTQQEMNHLQALRLRQQQQQQHLPQREVSGTFNPLLQSSLPLYSQTPTGTAFLQDLSFRRQEQLARALQPGQQRQQVVPQQTTMDPRQQQIDPRLLYLLLSRQQQQQQGRNPAAPP